MARIVVVMGVPDMGRAMGRGRMMRVIITAVVRVGSGLRLGLGEG